MIQRHGGAANRPGTSFVGITKDSSAVARLIRWVFNAAQTYALEFGNLYLRVIKDGAYILESPAFTITGATQSDPVVVTTSAPHGFSNVDDVEITGVVGMTQLNGRRFRIANVAATTFELQDPADGSDIDGTGFTAYASGGSVSKVFTVTTPYLTAELFDIQYVQSADIVTLVHPNHAPRELARTADDAWTLTEIAFEPGIARPANAAGTAGAAGTVEVRYRVVAIDAETVEQSLVALQSTFTITAATQANPVVVTTSAAHGFANDDTVFITGVVGMTEINDREFVVKNVTATTFELEGEDGTGFTAYASGGTVARDFIKIVSAIDPPTPADPNVLTWDAVAAAREYNIYKELNGVYGFIGIAEQKGSATPTFNDIGLTANTSDTPRPARNPFSANGGFPSAVTFYQQRLVFANTGNEPEKIFASRNGDFHNFTFSRLLRDDDAVTFTLAGRRVNEILHLVDLGRLVPLSTGAEWVVNGNEDGILIPTAINARQQSYFGTSPRAPIIIGTTAIYVQARGTVLRSLGFDFNKDAYAGTDLTIMASHLVDDFTISDMDYQQIPHSIVWVVRSDGTLLGMTFIEDHEIIGWHRHDFQGGLVESVAVIPEGNEDVLYLSIRRTINGKVTRYIERMNTRRVVDIRDSVFMDSELEHDGRNTTATTMTLSGGTLWTSTETLTLTSSTPQFLQSDADRNNGVFLLDANGDEIRFTIQAFTSPTVVTGTVHKTVPADLQGLPTTTWSEALKVIGGLWHLEGESISVLGDGFVAASPNNKGAVTVTVTGGLATLDRPYAIIHAGLPYVSDIETLDLMNAGGQPLITQNKLVKDVTLIVEESRGIFIGAKPPDVDTGDNATLGLNELKTRESEEMEQPVALATGPVNVSTEGFWNDAGRGFIRQVDPVPLTVLAVIPNVEFGGD